MPFMFAYTVVCRVKILILGFAYYLVESLEFPLKIIRHADVCMYVCVRILVELYVYKYLCYCYIYVL